LPWLIFVFLETLNLSVIPAKAGIQFLLRRHRSQNGFRLSPE